MTDKKNEESVKTSPEKSATVKNEKKRETAPKGEPGASNAGAAEGVAADGCKVSVNYKGTFPDGTIFDSSEGKEPLQFTLGAKQVVPGFENAIKGMKVGEKKDVVLEPKEAYGDHDAKLVQEVPKEVLEKAGITPEKGLMLALQHPHMPGVQLPAQILEVKESTVTMDLNHPMAGKTLHFTIELVKVE